MRLTRTAGALLILLACLLLGRGQAPSAKPAPEAPAVVAPAQAHAPEPAMPSEAEVREMIRVTQRFCGSDQDVMNRVHRLFALGDRAFPVFEAILADPTSEDMMVALTCFAIERVKVDRRRFLPSALKRLGASDAMYMPDEGDIRPDVKVSLVRRAYDQARAQGWARRTAMRLVGEIGDEREAPVIAPFLTSDADRERYAAAEALVKIGTHRELDALNACLKPGDPRRDANEMQYLTERRDELAKRLKDRPVPKTLTN